MLLIRCALPTTMCNLYNIWNFFGPSYVVIQSLLEWDFDPFWSHENNLLEINGLIPYKIRVYMTFPDLNNLNSLSPWSLGWYYVNFISLYIKVLSLFILLKTWFNLYGISIIIFVVVVRVEGLDISHMNSSYSMFTLDWRNMSLLVMIK